MCGIVGAVSAKDCTTFLLEGLSTSAGELKHGPLALVDAEMPVVVIAPNDEMLEKLKANMKAKQKVSVVGVG